MSRTWNMADSFQPAPPSPAASPPPLPEFLPTRFASANTAEETVERQHLANVEAGQVALEPDTAAAARDTATAPAVATARRGWLWYSATRSAGQVPLTVIAKRFLFLGAIAFGGPPAHVALFQVQTWRPELLDDAAFASAFALTQALPGPSSTQLAIAMGILMGGVSGGLVAFICFSLIATTTMAILGCIFFYASEVSMAPEMEATLQGVQMGLAAAAVSIAIKAALDLSAKLASEPLTRWLNALAAAANLLAPDIPWVLPLSLFVAGCVQASQGRFKAFWARAGLLADQGGQEPPKAPSAAVRDQPVTYFLAMLCLITWIALFAGLVFWQGLGPPWWADLFERFYRAGSLVWGGGPVVLPLLLPEVVPRFVSEVQFLQGFAFAQAMPGPMFNFAAYLGGVYQGPLGAIIAWFGLFLPGLLLIYAALPFWALATTHPGTQSFLKGVNAAASGLVIAAAFTLFDVVRTPPQRAITLLTFIIHNFFGPKNFGPKYNPPATIAIGALLGLPLCVPYALTHPRP